MLRLIVGWETDDTIGSKELNKDFTTVPATIMSDNVYENLFIAYSFHTDIVVNRKLFPLLSQN